MSASAVRTEVVRNRQCVEMRTLERLFGTGVKKSAFEAGIRAVTPNFVQTEISCERKTVLPNRQGPARVDFEIGVMSDLLNSVFLEVEVPPIKALQFGTWVWGLGFAMIERVEVIVENRTIETVYGDYLHFHEELHGHPGRSLEAACFRYKGITLPEMGMLSRQGFTMHVPIPTFFSTTEGAAPLPIQKMRACNREMKFRLYLRPLEDLAVTLPALQDETEAPNPDGLSFTASDYDASQLLQAEDLSTRTWLISEADPIIASVDPDFSSARLQNNNKLINLLIQYDHGNNVVVTKYRLFRDDTNFPKRWKFQGSEDGFIWTDLHDQTSSDLDGPVYEDNTIAGNTDVEISINSNKVAYRVFRFFFDDRSFSDDSSKPVISLRRIQFLDSDDQEIIYNLDGLAVYGITQRVTDNHYGYLVSSETFNVEVATAPATGWSNPFIAEISSYIAGMYAKKLFLSLRENPSETNPFEIRFDHGTPFQLDGYMLLVGNIRENEDVNEHYLGTWYVQGSSDGQNWETLENSFSSPADRPEITVYTKFGPNFPFMRPFRHQPFDATILMTYEKARDFNTQNRKFRYHRFMFTSRGYYSGYYGDAGMHRLDNGISTSEKKRYIILPNGFHLTTKKTLDLFGTNLVTFVADTSLAVSPSDVFEATDNLRQIDDTSTKVTITKADALSPESPVYMTYTRWEPFPVQKYKLIRDSTNPPLSWYFEASFDGVNWKKLGRQFEFDGTETDLEHTDIYFNDALIQYKYYRWVFTSSSSNTIGLTGLLVDAAVEDIDLSVGNFSTLPNLNPAVIPPLVRLKHDVTANPPESYNLQKYLFGDLSTTLELSRNTAPSENDPYVIGINFNEFGNDFGPHLKTLRIFPHEDCILNVRVIYTRINGYHEYMDTSTILNTTVTGVDNLDLTTSPIFNGETSEVTGYSGTSFDENVDQATVVTFNNVLTSTYNRINPVVLILITGVTNDVDQMVKLRGLQFEAYERTTIDPSRVSTTADLKFLPQGPERVDGYFEPPILDGNHEVSTLLNEDLETVLMTYPNAQSKFELNYDHGSPVVLNEYRIFRSSVFYPTSWTFEASANQTNWTAIDTTYSSSSLGAPSGQSGDTAYFKDNFESYRYYRWQFTTSDTSSTSPRLAIDNLEISTATINSDSGVTNTWSDFDMRMWMGMTTLTGEDARALESTDTSHVVKLVEPLHNPDTEGQVIENGEMRLDLRLRHPTTQLMWAIADDARLDKTPGFSVLLQPFSEGVGSQIGPFCSATDFNVLREGSKTIDGGLGLRTSGDVQTTPRLFLPNNRFEFRGCDESLSLVEPLEYAMLQMNRENRLKETIAPEYYRLVTPFSNRRVPLDDQRIYTYAFTPWASDGHRLSLGSAHFGRLHEKKLQLRTRTRSTKPVRFIGFAETYNVFLSNNDEFAMKFV